MNKEQIEYYKEMWNRDRLIALLDSKNRLIGLVTFFLINDNLLDKFRSKDSWIIIEDEKNGHIVYIDQLIAKKDCHFHDISFNVWSFLKKHFKNEHINIDFLTWNRWKNNKLYYYTRRIKDGLYTSCIG